MARLRSWTARIPRESSTPTAITASSCRPPTRFAEALPGHLLLPRAQDRYTLERYDDGTDTCRRSPVRGGRDQASWSRWMAMSRATTPDSMEEHRTMFVSEAAISISGILQGTGDACRLDVSHPEGLPAPRDLRFEHGRLHESVVERAVSRTRSAALRLSTRGPSFMWATNRAGVYCGGRRIMSPITSRRRPPDPRRGDYISQYHEETRDAYARDSAVDFEYRRDEYHRHWATSIEETFDFHMRAFARFSLDNVPVVFSHSNPYRSFDAWG